MIMLLCDYTDQEDEEVLQVQDDVAPVSKTVEVGKPVMNLRRKKVAELAREKFSGTNKSEDISHYDF